MKRRYWFALSLALMSLVSVLAACNDTVSPNFVQITLTDDKIESSLTTFSQGITYHFLIQNRGYQEHEFMIVPLTMDKGMSTGDMDKMALAYVPYISLGKTGVVDYTFTQTYPAGSLEFASHLSDDYQRGMHLGILVQ